jgi:hypothetical protein
MNIDAECHLRINEVTDCGCVVTAIVRTDSAVPVHLRTHPVVEELPPLLGVAGLPDFYPPPRLTHYAVDLRIGDKAAADVVPANSSVELWAPTKTDNTACELPTPSYAYLVLRHLVDGVKAMPWQPCPEHAVPEDRRPGDILTVTSATAIGIRPEYPFHDPQH